MHFEKVYDESLKKRFTQLVGNMLCFRNFKSKKGRIIKKFDSFSTVRFIGGTLKGISTNDFYKSIHL